MSFISHKKITKKKITKKNQKEKSVKIKKINLNLKPKKNHSTTDFNLEELAFIKNNYLKIVQFLDETTQIAHTTQQFINKLTKKNQKNN